MAEDRGEQEIEPKDKQGIGILQEAKTLCCRVKVGVESDATFSTWFA